MVGAPCWPLKYIMSPAKAMPGIMPAVALCVALSDIANGELKPSSGD